MDKFFKVVGVIAVVWIAFLIIGWLLKFLVGALLWIAIIVGVVFVISFVVAKGKQLGNKREPTI